MVEQMPLTATADEAYAQVVRDGLRPLARGLAVLYVLFAVAHRFFVPEPTGSILALAAAVSAVVLLATAVALARRPPAPRWANAIAFGIGALILANCTLHLELTHQPRQTTNLALVLLGAGLFLLSWRWFIAFAVITWELWFWVISDAMPSDDWMHFGFVLVSATALAAGAHGARLTAQRRIAGLRIEEEKRRHEAEESACLLARSERRQRELIESGLGMVATYDRDGLILTVKQAAAGALGYPREDIEQVAMRGSDAGWRTSRGARQRTSKRSSRKAATSWW